MTKVKKLKLTLKILQIIIFFVSLFNTGSYAQDVAPGTRRAGIEIEFLPYYFTKLIEYIDIEAYDDSISHKLVNNIPDEILNIRMKTLEGTPDGVRAMGGLNYDEWKTLDSVSKRKNLKLSDFPAVMLIEAVRATLGYGKTDSEIPVKSNTPHEIKELLKKFRWNNDRDAIELRHANPSIGFKDAYDDLIKLITLSGQSPKEMGRFVHIHFSVAGKKMLPIASAISLTKAIENLSAGDFDLLDNYESNNYGHVKTRGYVRIIGEDRMEYRVFGIELEKEFNRVTTWIENEELLYEHLAKLIKKNPEALEKLATSRKMGVLIQDLKNILSSESANIIIASALNQVKKNTIVTSFLKTNNIETNCQISIGQRLQFAWRSLKDLLK